MSKNDPARIVKHCTAIGAAARNGSDYASLRLLQLA
jgi:hypothetical protein